MRSFKVVIIGSGFGGQCTAIRLLERGITDFRILERRSFMGGTWAQNTYPGAAVDVPSPLYAISSEPHPWTQMYADQTELRRYTEKVIAKHRLAEHTTLGANVEAVSWDDEDQRWIVKTTSAGVFSAQVLVNASGPLSTPVVPDFDGRDRFEGAAFHTNNWRHDVDLKGKRVAVVGSGASAAQVIPAIADEVGELHVFQRTPHWVLPRPDRSFSAFEQRLLSIRPLYMLLRWAIYWQLELRVIGFKYWSGALDLLAGRAALKLLEEQVPDPVLRDKLTPGYTIGCKRIILSSTLLPALSRSHVTLHDKTDAIARLHPTGIETAQGTLLDLDVIVWATGYDATDGAISYPVTGRGGRTLAEAWSEYPRAYLGTAMPGFPNLFVITGPNTGIGHTSALFIIESQLDYIMESIRRLDAAGHRTVEVRAEAEAAYTAHVHSEMGRTVWKSGGCNSWYQSKSGHIIAMFPGFSFSYRRLAWQFRSDHHVFA